MRLRSTAGVVLALFAASPLVAAGSDEGEIATDRPDFVESSAVVGRGRYQVETSVALERDAPGGTRSEVWSTPTLLRIGVSERWELRAETAGYLDATDDQPHGRTRTRGAADLALGAKWHARDGDGTTGRPGLAWLFHVDLDSGSSAFRGRGLRPSARLVAEWDLPHGVGFGLMPGLIVERNERGERFVGGILGAVASKALGARLRCFAEVAARQLATARDGGNVVTFDAGLVLLLSRSTQLDLALARGLTPQAPDLAVTVGWSATF